MSVVVVRRDPTEAYKVLTTLMRARMGTTPHLPNSPIPRLSTTGGESAMCVPRVENLSDHDLRGDN